MYADSRTVEARRSEFVCDLAVRRILSGRADNLNEYHLRFSGLVELISLDVNPGLISPSDWISCIGFARRIATELVQYEVGTRTMAVLETLFTRMERYQENRTLICHAFSLAVALFVQECVGLDRHVQVRSIFNFVSRSICEDANNIIGAEPQTSLEEIDNECIVGGRVRLPN